MFWTDSNFFVQTDAFPSEEMTDGIGLHGFWILCNRIFFWLNRFLRLLRDENWRVGCIFFSYPLSASSDRSARARPRNVPICRGRVYAVQIVYHVKKWLRTRDSSEYKGTRLSQIKAGAFDYPSPPFSLACALIALSLYIFLLVLLSFST